MDIYTPLSVCHSKLIKASYLMLTSRPPRRVAMVLGALCLTIVPLISTAKAQTVGDVVVIGTSPDQQAALQDYWNQLMGLRTPQGIAEPSPTPLEAIPTPNPQQLEQVLLRNVRVSLPELRPIIGLRGSSQVRGTVTNGNSQAITVTAINYEIVDNAGNLLETGSAVPQPSTVAPGQTVTFSEDLLATSVFGKRVRLAQPPVVLQGRLQQ
jgi:hypothetical protein